MNRNARLRFGLCTFCLGINSTAQASEVDYSGEFARMMSMKSNTGCHVFDYVDSRDLQLAYRHSNGKIAVGNLSVENNTTKNCRVSLVIDAHGSYHSRNVELGNVNAEGYENVEVQINGKLSLSGNKIDVGNVDLVTDGRDEISIKQVISLEDVHATDSVTIGNTSIRTETGIVGNITIKETISIRDID